MSRIVVGNGSVDHSDAVGALPIGAAPTTSSFFDFTHGLDGLYEGICKTGRNTFYLGDLVRIILVIGWYV